MAGFAVMDHLQTLPNPPRILLLTCRDDDVVLFSVGVSSIAKVMTGWRALAPTRSERLEVKPLHQGVPELTQRSLSLIAGLIWKSNCTGEHLRSAFSAVIAGKDYFPPEVDDAVHRFRSSPDAFSKIFSDREIFLLDDFADGLSDKAIAAKRNLNQETVHSHRKHIMAKLGLHRTPDLILWAKDKGFGSHLAKTPRPGSSQPF